jgi:hypothetical protein
VGYLYAGRGRSALLLLLLWNPAELGILLLAVVVPVPLANIVIPLYCRWRPWALGARAARAVWVRRRKTCRFFSRWYACLTGVVVTVPLNLLAAHVYRDVRRGHKIPTGSMEADPQGRSPPGVKGPMHGRTGSQGRLRSSAARTR